MCFSVYSPLHHRIWTKKNPGFNFISSLHRNADLLSNLFRSADSICLCPEASELPSAPLAQVREQATNVSTASSSGQLILPEALKTLATIHAGYAIRQHIFNLAKIVKLQMHLIEQTAQK